LQLAFKSSAQFSLFADIMYIVLSRSLGVPLIENKNKHTDAYFSMAAHGIEAAFWVS